MTRLTLSDLPEVLVSFETVRAKLGKIVFYNKKLEGNLSESALLSGYNYVIAGSDAEVERAVEKKIFHAERYGGDGILTNGGGGRCGYDGIFHLKGLGANQLVGARPRDGYGNSHGNGFLSLDIAIYESIWAEIIDIALPHGSVRSAAVIDLEVDFKEPDQIHPRGLLVRVPAVRPAHFIRAVYFKEKKHGDLSEDAKRVMLVVRKLVHFLPKKGGEEFVGSMERRLEIGMVELAKRFANQFAASRAKRIFHQSISASNVTLDGAWMDLAGATVFSNVLWWDGFNISRFMNEYSPAMESLQSMCFYLSKYKVISVAHSNDIWEKSVVAFTREYEHHLHVYTAVQVGFPLRVIQDMRDDPIFVEFSETLQKVLGYDDFSLVPVSPSASWQGDEHYVALLYRQLLVQKFTEASQDLSWFCKDRALIARLVEAYDQLVEKAIAKAEVAKVSRQNFTACMAINTTRLNRVGASLLNVFERITEVRVNSANNVGACSYSALFDGALRDAWLAYNESTSFDTLLWRADEVVIYFDGLSGCFVEVDGARGKVKFSKFVDVSAVAKGGSDLLVFYNDVKEFLP
ncbi:hypothetical protein ACMSI6_13145 [Pseudomonas antarctica]|uniref:hypothetical protein n=1 Tax=Pseudomonas antarctica TaxID=219572 RepID=UPI0039C49E41